MGEAYRPKNSDNKFNGPTRLRQALYRSINLVTIRVLLDIGAGKMIDYAKNFGFPTTRFPRNTQLAVGGGTMTLTPLEMARAYAVFANGGYLIEPWGIDRLLNAEGTNLIQSHPPAVCHEMFGSDTAPTPEATTTGDDIAGTLLTPAADSAGGNGIVSSPDDSASAGPTCLEPAIDRRIAYIMNDMLRDVIKRGTARRALALKRDDLAGKTGTTDEAADTWFNGYSPDVATTVWVGFTELEPLGKREFGATTPLPIWIDYMKVALAGIPERYNDQPEGLVNMRVGGSEFEYFLAESTPRQRPVSTESSAELADESAAPVPVEDTSSIQSTDLF
jgi:penicillin-binding protein 1A